MKDPLVVLAQKEEDVRMLRIQIYCLKTAASLLAEPSDVQSAIPEEPIEQEPNSTQRTR